MATKAKPKAKAKKVPSAAERKREAELAGVGAWIECAASLADALRDRARTRSKAIGSDLRFATLARDVWAEHARAAPPTLGPLLARYVTAASTHARALDELIAALAPLADAPEAEHVHLPSNTVAIERVRAAGITSAKR